MQMFPHPVPRPDAALSLTDNMFAPEIAVAGVAGMAVINGVVTITLESVRCDHSKPLPELERIVVGRLAASVPAAQALMTGLYEFLGQHGLNPLTAPAGTCQ